MSKFKTGDTVTILSWEELAARFITDSDGDLELNALLVFPASKKVLCGEGITIEVILDNGEMYGGGLWFTPECIVQADEATDCANGGGHVWRHIGTHEDGAAFFKCRHCPKESEM